MKSLEELRGGFASADTNQNQNTTFGENYPFWNIKDGEQATIRFLPDANDENPIGFLLEKLMHTLYVDGQRRSVPCLKMYGEDCPICKLSAEYYNADDKVNGKRFYRNKQHIARAVIVNDPIERDGHETADGQIKTVTLGWQIYEKIKNAFESGELDAIPFDYEEGYNFNIKKKITKSDGKEYANYNNSDFARRSTPVTKHIDEDEIVLIDLSTLLPAKPDINQVEEWLEADLGGGSAPDRSQSSSKPTSEGLKDQLENLKQQNAETKKEKPKKTKPKKEPVEDVEPSSSTEAPATDASLDAEADAILAEIFANREQAEDE